MVTIKFSERRKIMLTELSPIIAMNMLTKVAMIVLAVAVVAIIILKIKQRG